MRGAVAICHRGGEAIKHEGSSGIRGGLKVKRNVIEWKNVDVEGGECEDNGIIYSYHAANLDRTCALR